jgi:hypothetical protein
MGNDSLFSVIETVWVIVTLVYGALLSYRYWLSSREDDQLLLEASDSGLEQEQKRIQSGLNRVAPYTRGFGWASLALLVVVGGVWIYRSYQTFVNPPQP